MSSLSRPDSKTTSLVVGTVAVLGAVSTAVALYNKGYFGDRKERKIGNVEVDEEEEDEELEEELQDSGGEGFEVTDTDASGDTTGGDGDGDGGPEMEKFSLLEEECESEGEVEELKIENPSSLSVKELKTVCKEFRIDLSGCIEKSDMVQRVKEAIAKGVKKTTKRRLPLTSDWDEMLCGERVKIIHSKSKHVPLSFAHPEGWKVVETFIRPEGDIHILSPDESMELRISYYMYDVPDTPEAREQFQSQLVFHTILQASGTMELSGDITPSKDPSGAVCAPVEFKQVIEGKIRKRTGYLRCMVSPPFVKQMYHVAAGSSFLKKKLKEKQGHAGLSYLLVHEVKLTAPEDPDLIKRAEIMNMMRQAAQEQTTTATPSASSSSSTADPVSSTSSSSTSSTSTDATSTDADAVDDAHENHADAPYSFPGDAAGTPAEQNDAVRRELEPEGSESSGDEESDESDEESDEENDEEDDDDALEEIQRQAEMPGASEAVKKLAEDLRNAAREQQEPPEKADDEDDEDNNSPSDDEAVEM